MFRSIYLIAVACALVWSGTASAIVQDTSITATSTASSVPVQTITITQKPTATSKPVKTIKITVRRNETKTVRTKIDDQNGTFIDIIVTTGTGQSRTVTIPLSALLGGGPIDLGDGLTLRGGGPGIATPAPVPYTWSGFYVGGMGVGSFAHVDWTEFLASSGVRTNGNSASSGSGGGGVSIGYNSDSWYGAAFTAMFLNQAVNFDFPGGAFIGEKVKVILTLTAQASWYPTPQWRLYALGGPALVEKEFTINFITTAASSDQWLWGGTLGAGVEYRFDPRWSLFLQYQHIWVEDGDFNTPTSSPFFNYKFENNIDIIAGGVNFRF